MALVNNGNNTGIRNWISMKYLITRVLMILGILALSIPAAWASKTETSPEKGWSFTASPYIWGASLEGTVAAPPLPAAEVDASFIDIIKNTNIGFMGVAELRKGRFGIINDIVWLSVSADSDVLPAPISRNVKAELDHVMASLMGAYRLVDKDRSWLDLVLGVRGWYVDQSIKLVPGILNSVNKATATEGWVDVIGGLRTRMELGKGFYASTLTLAGGGSSKAALDLMGSINYAVTDQFLAEAGYRYVKVNYEKSGFEWDLEYHGPILGGRYTF
jgi:hypothetical protein